MKTEKELLKRRDGAIEDLKQCVEGLPQLIEDRDWEQIVEFAIAIHTGACVISVAEGFLED